MSIEFIHRPRKGWPPYRRIPDSTHRVKLRFRIDFENGGHLDGEGFLLDLQGETISHPEAADILVSAMNLFRVDTVTIRELEIVRRGVHDNGPINPTEQATDIRSSSPSPEGLPWPSPVGPPRAGSSPPRCRRRGAVQWGCE